MLVITGADTARHEDDEELLEAKGYQDFEEAKEQLSLRHMNAQGLVALYGLPYLPWPLPEVPALYIASYFIQAVKAPIETTPSSFWVCFDWKLPRLHVKPKP